MSDRATRARSLRQRTRAANLETGLRPLATPTGFEGILDGDAPAPTSLFDSDQALDNLCQYWPEVVTAVVAHYRELHQLLAAGSIGDAMQRIASVIEQLTAAEKRRAEPEHIKLVVP